MDKHKKLKRQVSNDGGQTWQDMIPYEYIAGELIQRDSPDCNNVEWRTVSGYICEENTTEMTQWVADTGYVCVGFDKYNKEKEQVSYNSGISWADTGNTRAGSTLIEQNSEDCGYVPTPIIRWVADTGYVCVGYDKHNKEKEQQSTDGGTTWTDTGNTRAGSTLIEANSTDCGYSPHDYSTEYLTTEALGNGKIRLKNVSAPYDREPITNIQYSKNNGVWRAYTYDTYISVVSGDKIRWKATIKDGNTTKWSSNFDATADYKIYGNPLSLLDNDGFVNNPDSIYNWAYYALFWHSSTLKDASGLALPATTLARGCYCLMFEGCTSLTAAPALPATTLADECYSWMFCDCTSLTTAPVLPATTLEEWCYRNMFEDCSSLTTVPELPATTLTYGCYNSMFESCSSLTTAPVLPATVLTNYCYNDMFSGCTNLNNVTCCATDISASNCTSNWLYNVAATGTFNKDTNTTWSTGVSGIPSGWTTDTCGCEPTHDYSRNYLTTEALSSGNITLKHNGIGGPIKNIQYSKNDGAWTSYYYSTDISVVAGDKIRWKATIKDDNNDGHSIFAATADYKVYGNPLSLLKNDSFIDEPDAIYENAYSQLFIDSTTLKDASNLALPATTLAEGCYRFMFRGCTSLTSAPELPATTLADFCYTGMFYRSSLTTAPVLPATKLTQYCYFDMFNGCTNLNYIKCLATFIPINKSCTGGWTYGVSSTGTFVKNAAMSVWEHGEDGIPSGWTVQDA